MREKLKALRERYGWTQFDLSCELDVSLDSVKQWEKKSNPTNPGIKNRFKLNQLFDKAGIK